jgi:ectoine hydroxylase-related dioxygenase (phytanoyl-CoA dioxygenase family)
VTILPEQVERYRRDGILFPLPAILAAEAERCRWLAEEALARDASAHLNPHLKLGWARELATHPRVVAAAEAVLGPCAIWASMLMLKKAKSRSYVSWHQDGAYRDFAGGDVVSIWVALADSTPANGCMRVVRGSHARRLPHVDRPDPDNMIRMGKHAAVEIDEKRVTDVVLRAGEMSLHHNDLLHASGPNASAGVRLGLVVRFMRLGLPWSEGPLIVPRQPVG